MRKTWIRAALLATATGPLVPACAPGEEGSAREVRQPTVRAHGAEIEPNDAPEQATPISADGSVTALIAPDGDEDLFSFEGSAGERVFAATATAFSASSPDTVLELLGPGGALVESDDDSGSISDRASSIAGAALAEAGTHHLRVRQKEGSASVLPYRLHVRKMAGSPAPESEPNDLLAQPLPPSGWVEGAIDPPSDVDVYTLPLQAGDTVFASLDQDPERDGAALDGSLRLGVFSGTFLDLGGTGAGSRALFATVRAAGTYGVAVASRGGGGTYQLGVGVEPAAREGACATFTSEDRVAIPAGPGLVTSAITVPGHPRIASVAVGLDVHHERPQDLDVSLLSPQGTRAALFTDIGAPAFPDIVVTIDDEAAFPAGTTPVLNGLVVQPEPTYRLDWLRGQDGGGTWTLHLDDDAAGAEGELRGWSLTLCEPPPAPACASGAPETLLAASFEEDDGGFTHGGVADTWARGAPAEPPGFMDCHGGTGCFKTGLTSGYAPSSSQELVSPPIDLTLAEAPITLRWAMKYQMESAQFDRAWVAVREAGGGGGERVVWRWAGPTMTADLAGALTAEIAGWGVVEADIGALAGKVVEIAIHLESDALIQYPGLAIDDVEVRACPRPACGNGKVEGVEACDDGNREDGDGCSATCTIEADAGTGGGGATGGRGGSEGGGGALGGSGGAGRGGAPARGGSGGDEDVIVAAGGCGCRAPGGPAPGTLPACLLAAALLLGRSARARGRRGFRRFVASLFVRRPEARTMVRPHRGSLRERGRDHAACSYPGHRPCRERGARRAGLRVRRRRGIDWLRRLRGERRDRRGRGHRGHRGHGW